MGQPEFVMRLLDGRHGSMTFAEIMAKVNDTRSAVQKTLYYLYKEHRISRVQDRDGIMSYNITPHGKQWLAKANDQRNGSGERPKITVIETEGPHFGAPLSSVGEPVADNISMAEAADLAQKLSRPVPAKAVDVTEAHAKDTQTIVDDCMNASIKGMIQGAENSGYNKGFARGYEAGYKQSAREAYEDGQRSVMKKLEVLLCGA